MEHTRDPYDDQDGYQDDTLYDTQDDPFRRSDCHAVAHYDDEDQDDALYIRERAQ